MTTSAHTTTPDSGHPIPATVARLLGALADVVDDDASGLDADACRAVLGGLTQVDARVVELRARVLARADDLAALGGRTLAHGYASVAGVTLSEARAQVRLARLLRRHARVREALAFGLLTPAQARVIAEAVDALPPDAADWVRVEALEHLIAQAAHFDAPDLARLGRRVLEVVDPAAGEAQLARRLAAEEKAAAEKTMLAMSDDGHGLTHGRFRVPSAQGRALRDALLALVAEQRSVASTSRPSRQELGEAFCAFVSESAVTRAASEASDDPGERPTDEPDEPTQQVVVLPTVTAVDKTRSSTRSRPVRSALRLLAHLLRRVARRSTGDLAHTNPIQRT